MNLAVLEKTNRNPQAGDIFVMQPTGRQFLYGRVISIDANPLGVGRGILVYVYRVQSTNKTTVPELLRGQLLIPPVMTNKQPWTRGYFEHIANRPLKLVDRLPQHCFRDSHGGYFDESGNRLPGRIEPVGQWGLHSFRTIDDEISRALGIELTRDD